jgi:hypothetical protein
MPESFAHDKPPSIWIAVVLIVLAMATGIGASALERLVGAR